MAENHTEPYGESMRLHRAVMGTHPVSACSVPARDAAWRDRMLYLKWLAWRNSPEGIANTESGVN